MKRLSICHSLALAALALSGASPAMAGTVLDAKHDVVQRHLANEGVGRSVGSFSMISGNGESWRGSGIVLSANNSQNVWVLTAAHVVATLGKDGDGADAISGYGDFATASSFYTPYVHTVRDWYVPDSYDGTVVTPYDIALVRLDTEMNTPGQTILAGDNGRELFAEYEVYGFGTTGTGATGNQFSDGARRFGRNRFDIDSLDSGIVMSDFDVNPTDELYGGGGGPRPYNYAIEDYYWLQNIFETSSFPNITYPYRINPEKDYRRGFEYSITAGDSGGGAFFGDQIAGVTSFGNVTEEKIGGYFTFQSGFVRTAPWQSWIEAVIAQVEGGGPVTGDGVNGVAVGTPDTDPILDEVGGESNTLSYNALVAKYYTESEAMSLLDKVRITARVPVTADTSTFSNAQIKEAIGLDATASDLEAHALLDTYLDGLLGPRDTPFELQSYFNNMLAPGLDRAAGQTPDLPDFLFGDADGDDDVDMDDLQIVVDHLNMLADQTGLDGLPVDYFHGDFNLDGIVDENDLEVMRPNWLASLNGTTPTGPDFDAAVAELIPEPASLALLGLGLAGLTLRRRR